MIDTLDEPTRRFLFSLRGNPLAAVTGYTGPLRPDQEAAARVLALLRSRGIHSPDWRDVVAAAREVFAALPKLARSYQFQHDTAADVRRTG